jgi:hypothetical protein
MVNRPIPPEALNFLASDPTPILDQPIASSADPADRLPQDVIDQLMQIKGVDGVWIERDASGHRVVVLHYTPPGPVTHLPTRVHGLPTRVVGGEPINAL